MTVRLVIVCHALFEGMGSQTSSAFVPAGAAGTAAVQVNCVVKTRGTSAAAGKTAPAKDAPANASAGSAKIGLLFNKVVVVNWRKRMGIEPTPRVMRDTGFEDQGGHQTPNASIGILQCEEARE